jgi:hypothetical protein
MQLGRSSLIMRRSILNRHRLGEAQGRDGQRTAQNQNAEDPSRFVVQQTTPTVLVDQASPQVTVRQPQPNVTVDIPQPEITVRMPQPHVNVAMAQPQVQVV